MQSAAYYLNQAKECRRQADRAQGVAKEYWLRLERQWRALAVQAETVATKDKLLLLYHLG
jgi:hypothetical protein